MKMPQQRRAVVNMFLLFASTSDVEQTGLQLSLESVQSQRFVSHCLMLPFPASSGQDMCRQTDCDGLLKKAIFGLIGTVSEGSSDVKMSVILPQHCENSGLAVFTFLSHRRVLSTQCDRRKLMTLCARLLCVPVWRRGIN